MSNYVYTGMGAVTLPRFQVNLTPQKLVSGRDFLARRNASLAEFSKRYSVRSTSAKVVSGNKIKADVSSPWADWNAGAAKMIAPFKRQILALDILPRGARDKIVSRPLDAMIDLFDPLFDRLARAEQRVLTKHLNGGKRVEWWGSYLDLRLTTEIDARMDESTKNITRKLRILRNFFVLWTKSAFLCVQLIGECLVEGVDLAKDVAQTVGKAVEKGAIEAGKTIQEATEEASEFVAGVADSVGSFVGSIFSGLGTTGGAAEAPAAGASATIFGVPVATFFSGVISVITGAISATASVLSAQEATKKAEAEAAAAASTGEGQRETAKAQAFPVVPVAVVGVTALALFLLFSPKKD